MVSSPCVGFTCNSFVDEKKGKQGREKGGFFLKKLSFKSFLCRRTDFFTGRHSVYFRLFFSELRYPVPNITKNIKNVIFIDSMRSRSIKFCAFSKDIVCNNKFDRNKKYVRTVSVLYIFMPRKEKMWKPVIFCSRFPCARRNFRSLFVSKPYTLSLISENCAKKRSVMTM